jgi:microcystin-dependent protein
MAQGFLIGLPQRLFDADGVPADGWKLYFTNAGLGTPVTTYEDATLMSANSDPVVTDSSGYYRAFVAEAVIVDIEVKNASGVSQFTVPSIEAMPDTSGNTPSVTAVPTGGIIQWSTDTAPTGFLLCQGQAVNRVTYAALNTLLSAATPSYPFGNGDGSTTFNLPDLRQRFPIGVAASGTGSTLGGTGGTIDHVHTGPSHTHTLDVPRGGWGAVQVTPDTSGTILVGSGAGVNNYLPTGDQTVTSAAGGTGNTGTANPPFLSVQFIIKT